MRCDQEVGTEQDIKLLDFRVWNAEYCTCYSTCPKVEKKIMCRKLKQLIYEVSKRCTPKAFASCGICQRCC